MKLKLGDSVVVKTAQAFNTTNEHPAIVNCVWDHGDLDTGPRCMNVMVLPDCGTPFCMTSVLIHKDKATADAAAASIGMTNNYGWCPE